MNAQQLKRLQQELNEKKNNLGLVGTRLEMSEIPGNSLSAHITLDFLTISLNYGESFNAVPDLSTERFVRIKDVINPDKKIGEEMLEHEAGHRENPTETRYGCPYDVKIHDRIKDAITKALQQKSKKGLEDYVTNTFEDILDNVNCRRKTDFAGQTLFWNNQGLVVSKNQKFTPFYEAFVKINCMLGCNLSDTTLLRRFYTNKPEISSSIKTFLDYMKQQLHTGSVIKLHEKPAFNFLFNHDLEKRTLLWENLAYQFAIATAELLEEMPNEQMFGFPENWFDKQMKDPKTRQEIVFKRYKQGKPLSVYRDSHEQLYDLYCRLSREIPVETPHYIEATSMPLVFFGKRFVGENEKKFKFRGIGFTEQGTLAVKTSKHSLSYPISYKTHPRRLPKLKIALMDRSGSMSLNPDNETDNNRQAINIGNTNTIPWGDNSKYHYALKGYFGIDNFLLSQGISSYVEGKVFGFSGEETKTGGLEEVAKSLLVKPSGGTSFDIERLEKELEQGTFVLSISDGEFSLNEQLKQRIKNKVQECDYAHIQIGNSSEYSTFLKQLNIPVFDVKGDEDLSHIMVSFVSEYYKSQSWMNQ